jgi:hypothetical protein
MEAKGHGAKDKTIAKHAASEVPMGHETTNPSDSTAKQAHETSSASKFVKKKNSNLLLDILSQKPEWKAIVLLEGALIVVLWPNPVSLQQWIAKSWKPTHHG